MRALFRHVVPGLLAGLVLLLLAPATGLAAGQVSLRPAAGAAGSTAVLRASGFPASKRIKVGAPGLRARSVKTSRTGGFVLRLTVPKRSGWVTITSRGAGRRVASRFYVTSRRGAAQVAELAAAGGQRLRLSPTTLYPGSTLRVQGTGFARRRTLRLAGFGRAVRVRASRSGAFTAALRLPAVLNAGPRTVSLVGGGLRLAASMTVSARATAQGGDDKGSGDPKEPDTGSGGGGQPQVIAPAGTRAPTVSGSATVGATLSAGAGSWSGSPATPTYAWERCAADGSACAPIGGATGPSYAIVAADDGSTLRVVETATNAAGSASAPSLTTAVVRTPPTVTKSPSIPSKPQEGQSLTVTPGTYGGTQPITVTTQWQRCSDTCAVVGNSASYVVQAGDVGFRLVAVQTATNAAGSVQAGSARSQPVTPKPADTATGTVAHWTMDDTGATMADASGHGHNGTLHNVATGVTPAVLGTAFGFSGNGYAYVPQSDELSAVDRNVTLTLSFKAATVSNTGEQDWDLMRSAGGYYDGDEYKLEYNPDGSVLCAFKGSTGYTEAFSAPLALNQWHTVKCAKTATQVKITVDGVPGQTKNVAVGTIVLTKGLIFGAHPSATETGASEFFRGQLDEASIAIG